MNRAGAVASYLRVSSLLYQLAGLGLVGLAVIETTSRGEWPDAGITFLILGAVGCLAVAWLGEVVSRLLERRRFRAWFVGTCVGLCSFALPLALIGLLGTIAR